MMPSSQTQKGTSILAGPRERDNNDASTNEVEKRRECNGEHGGEMQHQCWRPMEKETPIVRMTAFRDNGGGEMKGYLR